jgi:sulfonate dioxygenase
MDDATPLYPVYLPTRPDGFTSTIDVPLFDAEEPGTRANTSKPVILGASATIENITPRVGSEVSGVQLSKLSAKDLDEVALLVAERGVLVFVGHGLTHFHVVSL